MTRLLTLAMIVALTGPAAAQTPPDPQAGASDALALLTAELRALRTETARASIRLQLLVARLQLQEQRIMYLDRQRSDVSGRLANVRQQRAAMEGAVKMFGDADPKNEMAKGVRAQIAVQQAQEQELRGEEDQLLTAIAGEQARWTDLSSRLEELERSLAAR